MEGDEVLPLRLLDVMGVCLIEIVDGQYRVEKLQGEENVKEQGE